MELFRGEPWYTKGVILDFHPEVVADQEGVLAMSEALQRLLEGNDHREGAVWVAEVSNSNLFKRLLEEVGGLDLRLLFEVDLTGSSTHEAIAGQLGYWLDKGVSGFKSDAVVGGWLSLPTDSDTLCGRLAPGRDIDALEDRYFELPALSAAFAGCARHPAHRAAGLDLAALEWSARSFREFIGSFESHLGPDDWPRYRATGLERYWTAGGLARLRARLLTLLLLTLRGTPLVPGMMADIENEWTAREDRNPDSNINFMRHMLALRSTCPALWTGDYHALTLEEEDVFGYVRETELQRITVVMNFSPQPRQVSLSGPVGDWIAGTHLVQGDGQRYGEGPVNLGRFEGRVYEQRRSLA